MSHVARAQMTITNDTACLQQVRDLVNQGIAQGGYPAELTNRVMLAVDEAVTNIIEHAYPDLLPGKGRILIDLECTPSVFRVQIEDDGVNFTGEAGKVEIDIAAHVEQGRSGGLGVFLMRSIMDVVDYSYESGVRNRLILIKYAKPRATT